MDWEEYISEIASDIMKEQSPKRFVFDAVCSFLIFLDKQNVSLNLEVVNVTNFLPDCVLLSTNLLYQLLTCNASFVHRVICFRLFQVRGKLYELLINCIPPEIILKVNLLLYNVPI